MATSPVLDIGELVQQDMVVKGLHRASPLFYVRTAYRYIFPSSRYFRVLVVRHLRESGRGGQICMVFEWDCRQPSVLRHSVLVAGRHDRHGSLFVQAKP